MASLEDAMSKSRLREKPNKDYADLIVRTVYSEHVAKEKR